MIKNKKFDCVKMKWDIQRQLKKKNGSVSQRNADIQKRSDILADGILGPFLQKITQSHSRAKALK